MSSKNDSQTVADEATDPKPNPSESQDSSDTDTHDGPKHGYSVVGDAQD